MSLVAFGGVNPSRVTVHPCYHFHGFAGDQSVDDSVFYDKSGTNHATRGAHLSASQLWTTASGYASTIDPVTNSTDSVLRMPKINFDYSSGEKLIVWMLGKWTPEASAVSMIGDGYSNTAGQRGWAIRVGATGKVQPVLYGAATGFGGSSTESPFVAGELHSFGVLLDGQNKKYGLWVDDVYDTAFGSAYLSFNSGTDADTRSTNTVNIGATSAAPGGTAGIATAVRACVVMRLAASRSVPPIADITAAFKQLRANPGKLLLASAF